MPHNQTLDSMKITLKMKVRKRHPQMVKMLRIAMSPLRHQDNQILLVKDLS